MIQTPLALMIGAYLVAKSYELMVGPANESVALAGFVAFAVCAVSFAVLVWRLVQ